MLSKQNKATSAHNCRLKEVILEHGRRCPFRFGKNCMAQIHLEGALVKLHRHTKICFLPYGRRGHDSLALLEQLGNNAYRLFDRSINGQPNFICQKRRYGFILFIYIPARMCAHVFHYQFHPNETYTHLCGYVIATIHLTVIWSFICIAT